MQYEMDFDYEISERVRFFYLLRKAQIARKSLQKKKKNPGII